MAYSQEGRLITLTTPLGDDVLLLAGLSGHEAISRLFSFKLDLLTEQGPIAFTDIIGKSVTISITQSDDTPRYFNGIVNRFAASGADARFMRYQMEVVPWTWKLTRFADCKIFHNKTVGDIIQKVFSDRGFTDFKVSLTGSYTPLEYCVQYRETDFNFISRLMEQNGIFYFFEHEDGKHTMVIADSASIHTSCPGFDSAGYNLSTGGLDSDDVVNSWSLEQELRSGMYTLTDYYFETPAANLLATESTVYEAGDNSSFELFDFPGDYTTRGDGSAFAKLRMQEEEAGHLIAHGGGVCRSFTTGYKFELTDHPDDTMNDTYVLTEIQHEASVAGNYTTGFGAGDHYSNRFTCIPVDVQFRPARITPKPFVQGPQTATVVGSIGDSEDDGGGDAGSSGNEIWVDKYGRVIVLFPWDRKGACSCWVRVSQDWAGQGWGSITIPRVGQEVIVSFLEGDPDRPIITGRVYNASQTVPYPLPDNQTRSTFMTRSSKGGSEKTYNELRFEDKTGKEQIFLRGQYDFDTQILHDSREAIGNNRSLTVASNQLESVGGDLNIQVAGKVYEKVGDDTHYQITGDYMGKHTGDVHNQVSGAVIETVGGDSNSNISGNLNEKVGQTHSMQVGQNLQEKIGQAWAIESGQTIYIKAGMTCIIEAGMQLSLVVGGNFIDIGPAGVSIKGTMVMINSGGAAGSGTEPQPTDPGTPTDPKDPTAPDKADDGSTGTKLGAGSAAPAAAADSEGAAAGAGSSLSSALGAVSSAPAGLGNALSGAAGAASQAEQAAQQAAQGVAQQAGQAVNQAEQAAQGVANQAQQALTQAQQAAQGVMDQAVQAAQQAADQAKQLADQAQQAVKDAEQQAQQAVDQVKDQAKQAYQQAQQAVQQAQQAVGQAIAQGKAAAQGALNQAEQMAQQATQAATQAVKQAQQAAQQVVQQAQQAANQAKQAAQQAVQQAEQAAKQAAQQAQAAVQQAKQQAQQALQQAQQAAKQAQQQAQQAAQQVQQAASQAGQQAKQAAQSAQQAASQAINQAGRGY